MVDPFELMKTLHALSAVDASRAVHVEKLGSLLQAPRRELDEALKALLDMQYVSIVDDRIFLTELGILKISSLFC